ncbi:MAG: hypothetical protein IRZ24_17020, partial [Thermogemmatispora sp.]
MRDFTAQQYRLSRRAFLSASLAAAGGLALAACGGSTATSAGGNQYTVALILGVKGDPFYITMQKGAEAKAKELGVTLLVDGPAQSTAARTSR